jgi:hypothetical protein
MNRLLIGVLALVLGAAPATAQSIDDLNIQIHGYAAQGFLYTTHNNIFYANSSNGSPAWTEAVLNVSARPIPKLRIAVQTRYFLLGSSGNAVILDWAAGDYKVNDRFGVRFGKVKSPWGLFNETQDIDPSYMWSLLPQCVYDITTRAADLTHNGGVVYGTIKLGPSAGKMEYRAWGGEQVIPTNDGSFNALNAANNGPLNDYTYVTYGAALHWLTPIPGLMLGASEGHANQSYLALQGGSESIAEWNRVNYFGKYEKDKIMFAAEWQRQASPGTISLVGRPTTSLSSDPRAWYGMATYKLTGKLTAGVYDSQEVDHDQPLGPGRYTKDWTVSGRYDFNQFIYLKAEQHFIDGTYLSFDTSDNVTLQPNTKLTALKVGVSF